MRKNKGISLIVLVITIIVIIILATAILVSVISNNPISEANEARYESDRDNMQAVFTNTVGKIMAENQGVVNVTAGQINTETSGVNETTGEVAYTVDNAINEENASGTIIFDKGTNDATTYYTGKQLPIYAAGETKWYVDSDGVMSLEVSGVKYGSGKIEKELVAGFYDENNQLLMSWSEFESYGIDIEAEHDTSDMAFFNPMSMLLNYEILYQNWEQQYINSGLPTDGKLANTAKIILPNTITRIGKGVFSNCQVDEIILPDTVIEIGEGAFADAGIKHITIPSGVLELIDGVDNVSGGNSSVFGGNEKLESVTISTNLNKIGKGVFQNCTLLSNIYYDGTMEQWNSIKKYYDSYHEMYGDDFYACWNQGCPEITVHCIDGDIVIPNHISE